MLELRRGRASERASLRFALLLVAAGAWAQAAQKPPSQPAAAARPGAAGERSSGELRTTVWRGREVTYEVIDGWAVHDGDILLGRVGEIEAAGAGAASPGGSVPHPGLRREAAPIGGEGLWPDGIVPYEIVEDATEQERADILAAMAEWNARTAVTFVPRSGQRYYASLVRSTGWCRSGVGRDAGTRVETVGCGVSTTVHELGHAIGLWHEHQRTDRDEYIMVPRESDFMDVLSLSGPGGGPFDYRSSMNYGGFQTIPPGMGFGWGSLDGFLSAGDVDGVNRAFGHPSEATVVTTNPPGLEIVVDGFRVTTPATFHWPAGSAHVLEAPLWQTNLDQEFSGSGGHYFRKERFLFGRWSDEGDRVHEITARPEQTWIEANFIRGGNTLSAESLVRPSRLALGLIDHFERFDASPRALSFVSAPGSDPPPGLIRLTNRGDGPERFQIVSDSPWLVAEPAEAGLAPGESVDIEVRALREGLRPEARRGHLRVRSEGLAAAESPAMPVAFVVLPEMFTVPLGAGGETVEVAVSDTEGFLGLDGRPLGRGHRVTASNGDVYKLAKGPDGITATFEPGSQSLDLPSGGRVTLTQHAEGDWRIGDERVQSGHRYAAEGHEHVLEMADGRWRVAPFAVRTVADWNDGPSPDGIPAVEASVRASEVAIDVAGNLYIAESLRHVVRKVDAAGVITTVAGTGSRGYSGDGGPATAARLWNPSDLALDAAGNLYIADRQNHVVRKVDAAGVITTVAGTGSRGHSGDGGPATAAQLWGPNGLALDLAGNLYVGEFKRVRKIDPDGVITTVAGSGESGYSGDGGPATQAQLGWVRGVAVDGAGNLYALDDNRIVRKIDAQGTITRVAGNGGVGYSGIGGPATEAQLGGASAVAVDTAGNLYVADPGYGRLLKIDAEGTITIRLPARASGLALDLAGNLYIAEGGKGRVLKIDPAGTRTRVAGTAERDHFDRFAVDSSGAVYMAPGREVLRIDPGGTPTSLSYSTYLRSWYGAALALDGDGSIFVASRQRLLKVESSETRVVATFPRHELHDVAVDGRGTVYVCGGGVDAGDQWQVRGWKLYPHDGTYEVDAVLDHRLDRGGARMRECAVDGSGRIWFETGDQLRVMEPLAGPSPAVVSLPGGGAIRLTRQDGGWTFGDEPVQAGHRYVRGGDEYVLSQAGEQWRVASVRVPLGASGGEAEIKVLADGGLRHEPTGRPLTDGSQITASNFDTYTLNIGPDGISATLVPRSQAVELERGGALRLSQDQNGIWRTGGAVVESGQEIVRNGLGYRFETQQGRWQSVLVGPLYSIRTVAGSSAVAEGVQASEAGLSLPGGIAVDAVGNLFAADTSNHRIRRVDVAGVIRTVAGSGEAGSDWEGGPATEIRLLFPKWVAADSAGNVYLTDTQHHRVRKIDAAGIITTVAGMGVKGIAGDGGPATEAGLWNPRGMALDAAGNLFVAEGGPDRVRKIDAAGIITTVAGTGWGGGFTGDGGRAAEARLRSPEAVAVDAAGNLYVADAGNYRVRKIDAAGIITTVAGTGRSGFDGDGGRATEARLTYPEAVAVDTAGNLFVTGRYGHRVRRVDAAGIITTVAGTGQGGFDGDGGRATEARLGYPEAVAVDTAGNVYVADTYNHRVRKIDAQGTVTTVAGTGDPAGGWEGVLAVQARRGAVSSTAVDGAGNLFYVGRNRVWKLDASGMVTAAAGTGEQGFSGDGGRATEARLGNPEGVAADAVGNLYVADTYNERVRKIDVAGTITTVAGGGSGGDGGPATKARLASTRAVAVDVSGRIYVAEKADLHGSISWRVRKIDTAGTITTVAGGGSGVGNNGPATEAELSEVRELAVDAVRNLYIADGGSLRKVDAVTGIISEMSRFGSRFRPRGRLIAVAVDGGGNVYAGLENGIERLDADGSEWVIAGTGQAGFNGDWERAINAELSVSGMTVDRFGSVWFTDPVNRRIRVLDPVQ